ncbi:MAG: hypothetical protein NWP91_06365 [Rickettsiaceae bacterium]|nr:hypothetical protein [Rickettsiaceae bacterium]
MKTLQQLPYDFSLNQELQQETVALMSVIKQIHTDDDLLIRKLREQLDTHTHRTTKKLELLKEEAALILEGLKLEEEEQTEEAEAQAEKQQHTFTTSRSLDLTGIRFIDVPDDLTPSPPTSREDSISSLITPATEDITLTPEPIETIGNTDDLTPSPPTSREDSISSLITSATEDITLTPEPIETIGNTRDCCVFDASTMCILL